MDKPKYLTGDWKVTRFCCTSGLCVDCHNRGNHGNKDKRKRIVHTYGVSEEWARFVADTWNSEQYSDWQAEAARMLQPPGEY